MGCIFCRIIDGEIPSTKYYEDDLVIAIKDVNPQTPFHALIMPKQHIECALEIDESNSSLIAHVFEVAAKIAKENGLDGGFRIINNCGEDAGQTVKHIHFHLLGGIKMSEKII